MACKCSDNGQCDECAEREYFEQGEREHYEKLQAQSEGRVMEMPDEIVSKIKKVEKCWLWTGSIGEKGYGIYRGKGAHVVVYEFYKGNVPKGLELDHLCRVTNCVSPEHLEAVTHKENCLRGVGVTAKNAKKEQCANGHALSGSNIKIVIRKDGTRRKCRKCHYLYQRKRREKINAK